jgi:hypothetical protein
LLFFVIDFEQVLSLLFFPSVLLVGIFITAFHLDEFVVFLHVFEEDVDERKNALLAEKLKNHMLNNFVLDGSLLPESWGVDIKLLWIFSIRSPVILQALQVARVLRKSGIMRKVFSQILWKLARSDLALFEPV